MRKTNKRGFTIVELVIVIAVIAILAAVLIPTFSNLVKKANRSVDSQLVRNLNTALAVENKEYPTMYDALEVVKAAGYDVTKIAASDKDNTILWDSVNQVFCYMKQGENVPEYIPNSKNQEVEPYQLWKIYTTAEEVAADPTYSVYWNGANNEAIAVTDRDFDAGYTSGVNVTYTGTQARSVVIRTNMGALTVTASGGTVTHYGMATTKTISDGVIYEERGQVIAEGISEIPDGAFGTDENGNITITESAFKSNTNLTSVNIPEGVTTIGNKAFYGCTNLTSVTIPESVTSIGTSAFYGCTNLTSVTIPGGVSSIGDSTFYNCKALTSVTIPESVTSIGTSAFYGCTNLTSVTIPGGVSSIGGSTFYNCKALTSVTIPDSVTTIGSSVFQNCSALTSVTIPDGVTYITDKTFSGCSSLTTVELPEGILSIQKSAFSSCSQLARIEIPSTVTTIGMSAFSDCSLLQEIIIPDQVTTINGSAFKNCSGLTSVTLPNVTTLGDGVFDGCSQLETVIIGEGVTSINAKAFINANISTLTVDENNTTFNSVNNCVLTEDGKTLVLGCKKSEIPDTVTTIGDYAFYGCKGITSITISANVTTIGKQAFYLSGLTSATFNDITNSSTTATWNCYDSSNNRVTSIIDSYLNNSTTAANYLTVKTNNYSYYNYTWKRA